MSSARSNVESSLSSMLAEIRARGVAKRRERKRLCALPLRVHGIERERERGSESVAGRLRLKARRESGIERGD